MVLLNRIFTEVEPVIVDPSAGDTIALGGDVGMGFPEASLVAFLIEDSDMGTTI